ncbi:MAG TPA: GreA/GreB family elongation factor [Steroidobacteraceae bacterium]|jgi:transcription elongation GreA/GreB family factor|nr:GreA/GreB family elongation factor [Steroidobacteraceae bacterium]
MSRAFTREPDDDQAPLPERALSTHPNLVTPEGLATLETRARSLEEQRQAARAAADRTLLKRIERDLRYFTQRLASARVVAPAAQADRVRFGVRVTLAGADGLKRSYRLVGEDEADAARGLVSWVSPLAQALLGQAVGDTVRFQEGELEILLIEP